MTKHFFTDAGAHIPAITADQMRALDRIAMEDTGPNLFQMMENAGRSLAALALDILGAQWNRARVVVLAGRGGNGGGGICATRHLANRRVNVTLVLADPDHLGSMPSFQRKIFQHTGGKEADVSDLSEASFDLILDALIGYGLRAAPHGRVSELILWANGTQTPILALDLPSGVDATTGEAPGACISARWTLTLALPKTGLVSEKTGALFLADIGIPAGAYRRAGVEDIPPFGERFWIPLVCR